MTDKIKLEDMTLGQIRALKEKIQSDMLKAMFKAVEPYDVGRPLIVSAETSISEIPYFF